MPARGKIHLEWKHAEILFEIGFALQKGKGQVDLDASIMQYGELHYCISAV